MKIAIDAGHGPNTPGKRSPDGSLREFQFNSAAARYVSIGLRQYEGVETLYTFDDDRDVPLGERTSRANTWGADILISIHANASGDGWSTAHGIESFVYITQPAASLKLAKHVQQALVEKTGLADRGVKTGNLHMLRESNMPAILVECGFMTNRREAELLKSDSFRMACAEAIISGIAATYHLIRAASSQSITPSENANRKPQEASPFAKNAQEWVILEGISDGTRPMDPVTREEIWTMLYRMRAKMD